MKLYFLLTTLVFSSTLHAQLPVIYTDKAVFQVGDTSGLRPEIIVFSDSHRSMVMDEGYTKLQKEVAPTLEKLTVIQHKDKPLYIPFFRMPVLRELAFQGNGKNSTEISGDLFELTTLRRFSISDMELYEHDVKLLKQRYPFIELNNVTTKPRPFYGGPEKPRVLVVNKDNTPIRLSGDTLIVGSKRLNSRNTWKTIRKEYQSIERMVLQDPKKSIPFMDDFLTKLFYAQLYHLEIVGEGEEIPEFCHMVAWRDGTTEVTLSNVMISQKDMDCIQTVPNIILISEVEVAQ